jgi:hypothetical protein
VERCKKCVACQGRYFEIQTVTAPPQISDPHVATGGWRKVNSEMLHSVFSSPNIIIKEYAMGGACGAREGMRNTIFWSENLK